MHKIYLILRNNKQNGPYTLDELVQLNLKQHDLIWVEGRSAGWRYPTEIEALKPYVAGAPADPAGQKNTSMPTEPADAPIRTISTADAVAVKQSSKAGKHIFISMPGGNTPVSPAMAAPAASEQAEEETPEAKLERRARELQQRIQAFSKQQEEKPKEETETKYARSLEDLRQDYANWLHEKKNKKKFRIGKTEWMVAAGLLLLVVSGFTIASLVAGTRSAEPEVVADRKTETLTAGAAFARKPQNDGFQTAVALEEARPEEEDRPVADPNRLTPEEEAMVNEYLASQERTYGAGNKKDAHTSFGGTSYQPRTSRNQTRLKELAAGETVEPVTSATEGEQKAATVQERKSVPLAELIALNGNYKYDDNRRHITGVEVTIQNNSDQLLKRVAVDVFYYKKRERLFEKETLYFNNVYPQNALTLSTSGNKKAVSARFQLGLITTE